MSEAIIPFRHATALLTIYRDTDDDMTRYNTLVAYLSSLTPDEARKTAFALTVGFGGTLHAAGKLDEYIATVTARSNTLELGGGLTES